MTHPIRNIVEVDGLVIPEPSDELLDQLLRKARARLDPALSRIRRLPARVAVVNSTIGNLLAAQSPRGLVALRFMDSDDTAEALTALRCRFDVVEDSALGKEIGDEIERLMRGEVEAISSRPIDLSLVQSDFQRRTLRRLRTVPAGSVVTYQGLAAAI